MGNEAAALDALDGFDDLDVIGGSGCLGGSGKRPAFDADSVLGVAPSGEGAGGYVSPDVPKAESGGFVRNGSDPHASESAYFPFSRAFSCAAQGVAFALRTQRNMKIHVAVGALAIALGFFLEIDAAAWLAVIVCIGLVLAAECLNTALESVVDLVSPQYSELARRAKDCAAGAVLLCAFASVAVAAVAFLPRIAALFG